MSFVQITGDEYTDLLRRRLTGELPELTWLQQFRDLLTPHLTEASSMLDIGCATGYAYNAFKKFGIGYTGLDFEDTYLKIGREYFSGCAGVEFRRHDITTAPSPVRADFVICSATLEHAPAMMPTLKHMADAAKQVFVLRTFLQHGEEVLKLPSPVAAHRDEAFKYNNSYDFAGIMRALHKLDFRTTIHPDRFTQSMPHLADGLARTFYVLVAQRGADPKANDPREVNQ